MFNDYIEEKKTEETPGLLYAAALALAGAIMIVVEHFNGVGKEEGDDEGV
jgi:hypothetical protein